MSQLKMNSLFNVRIARVSTVSFYVLTQLSAQLEALSEAGAEITVVASEDECSKHLVCSGYYKFKPIYIAKEINLFADVIALFKLWRLFCRCQFDIVHSTTPKAGLLCGIAGWGARIPVRLHTFTGQPWITITGFKKSIVKFCDKVIVYFNTRCYADSFSQRDFLVKNKIMPLHKISVLGRGSLAGIDLKRFQQENFSQLIKNTIRESLKIAMDALVILFVGRVTQDKGVNELLEAFKTIVKTDSDVVLLIVGPFENEIEQDIRDRAYRWCGEKVIFTGYTQEPEKFMAIADILCIPSYREGFGTVVIEAAAIGVPAIGTKIHGLIDAIVDGETGLLVEPKNSNQLAIALLKLIGDDFLRKRLGQNAKKRATLEFDSKKFSQLLVEEYKWLLMQQKKQGQLE